MGPAPKVAIAVITIIVVVLGIMLGIGFIKGDDTTKQDDQVTNSAPPVGLSAVSWPRG